MKLQKIRKSLSLGCTGDFIRSFRGKTRKKLVADAVDNIFDAVSNISDSVSNISDSVSIIADGVGNQLHKGLIP